MNPSVPKRKVHFSDKLKVKRYDPCANPDEVGLPSMPYWSIEWITPPDWGSYNRQKVKMRSVVVDMNKKVPVTGSVWVYNLCYEKSVFIRWSIDGWKTSQETMAHFMSRISPKVDDFRFGLNIPNTLGGSPWRLEMAVCYLAMGQEYWDNFYGQNYTLLFRTILIPEEVVEIKEKVVEIVEEKSLKIASYTFQSKVAPPTCRMTDLLSSPYYQGVRPSMESLLTKDVMNIGIPLKEAMMFTSVSSLREENVKSQNQGMNQMNHSQNQMNHFNNHFNNYSRPVSPYGSPVLSSSFLASSSPPRCSSFYYESSNSSWIAASSYNNSPYNYPSSSPTKRPPVLVQPQDYNSFY